MDLKEEKINTLMNQACELATQSVENGCGPFGCIITDENYNIISKEHNRVTELNDPTAHAEINAIRDACKKTNNFKLDGKIVFTSCEPCPMCLSALYWSRVTEIYYSNSRDEAKQIGFDDSYIYDELKKEIESRDIKIKKVSSTNSLDSFDLWSSKHDKLHY